MILELKDLSVRYGKIEALRNISMNIKKGEFLSLIGANGAGKSTLLKVLSGLIPSYSGKIFYKNRDISALSSDRRVKAGIAQVPEGRGLFPSLSVEDNLLLGAYTRKDREIKSDLNSIYEQFPILYEKRKDYAGILSGGQQQMVAVGRALMSRPQLILLDEPSMGLAPIIVEDIFSVISKLRENGTTVFMVEQNANLALSYSDRTYVLENGEIVKEGASSALLHDKAIQQAYLGG